MNDLAQAGTRVSGDARYNYCHPLTILRLRGRYQATGTVKDRRRSGQPRMANGVKTATYVDVYRRYLQRRYPSQLVTVSARLLVGFQG